MSQVKILVVEDEEFLRETIVEYLNMKGFENILTSSRGEDAIEHIEKEKPDFVFLDIQLADDVNGIEVLKKSRASSPDTKCIMMSAYQDEYGEEAMRIGAYCFLKKPIRDLAKIIKVISEVNK